MTEQQSFPYKHSKNKLATCTRKCQPRVPESDILKNNRLFVSHCFLFASKWQTTNTNFLIHLQKNRVTLMKIFSTMAKIIFCTRKVKPAKHGFITGSTYIVL